MFACIAELDLMFGGMWQWHVRMLNKIVIGSLGIAPTAQLLETFHVAGGD